MSDNPMGDANRAYDDMKRREEANREIRAADRSPAATVMGIIIFIALLVSRSRWMSSNRYSSNSRSINADSLRTSRKARAA